MGRRHPNGNRFTPEKPTSSRVRPVSEPFNDQFEVGGVARRTERRWKSA